MFSQDHVHSSWRTIIEKSLAQVDSVYLKSLTEKKNWLPGCDKILNAFSLPLSELKYILFGESPYPRTASANGYAFWDAAVTDLWSTKGLSKPVNRATSLRNFMKMLLIADQKLSIENYAQSEIAHLDKTNMIKTADALFNNMLDQGFLLLNTSLVLSDLSKLKEACYWYPFVETLLTLIAEKQADVQLILWGNIAKKINAFPISKQYQKIASEHPYNVSFISNPTMLKFFSNLKLLSPSH